MAQAEEKEKITETESMPKAIDAVKSITDQFANVLSMMQISMQQNVEFQAEIVKAINKPKAVKLGNVKRNAEGMMMGAEAVTVI